MPSRFSASCRPLLARKLNDRSLRPPMSVLLPHAATPRAPTARLRAIAIARDVLRCTAPPLRFLLAGRTPSAPARSLRRAPVGVVHSREQRGAELRLGEAGLDRRPGDREQLGVAPPEVLARDRVL